MSHSHMCSYYYHYCSPSQEDTTCKLHHAPNRPAGSPQAQANPLVITIALRRGSSDGYAHLLFFFLSFFLESTSSITRSPKGKKEGTSSYYKCSAQHRSYRDGSLDG